MTPLAKCRAAFPALHWFEINSVTLSGHGGGAVLEISRLQPRAWQWRLVFSFSGAVYTNTTTVGGRFAYDSCDRALASARASVQPLLDALNSVANPPAASTASVGPPGSLAQDTHQADAREDPKDSPTGTPQGRG